MENWFEEYAPWEKPVSEDDGLEAWPGKRPVGLAGRPFMFDGACCGSCMARVCDKK